MKGLFIPEITTEMFRNGCLESIEALMAEGEIYDIDYQQPCEDCIRELIREFDNKQPALFADYMREFNNHPISEIIEYMWDMHDLIEDIKYRLPNEGGENE